MQIAYHDILVPGNGNIICLDVRVSFTFRLISEFIDSSLFSCFRDVQCCLILADI